MCSSDLTSHSQLLTGLVNGTSYNYYVRCQDGSGNTNTNDYAISFSVSSGLVPVCGNSVLEVGEQCDDGNINNNDSCIIDFNRSYECKYSICGDGYLWNQGAGTEQCDDGNIINGDGCSSTCQIEVAINKGVVDLTWPPGINLFFDSYNLSTTVNYINEFVKFPGSNETRCLPIADYIFPSDPSVYNKSLAKLGTPNNGKTSVSSGDNYEVWNSPTCGL